MRNLTELVIFALAAASYWLFAPYISDRDLLFELINGLLVAVIVGILFYYTPNFVRAVANRPWTGGHFLAFGIITVAIGIGALMIGNIIHRLKFGDLLLWHDSLWRGWFLWIIFVGYVIKFLTKGAIEGRIPSANWLKTSVLLSVSIAVTYLIALYFGHTRLWFMD